jgi:hypothetical protein
VVLFLSSETHDSKPPRMRTRREVQKDLCHWNLWPTRMMPYKDLTNGTHVVLVESWRGGGWLTWEVAAVQVLAAPYQSKAEAVRMIARRLKITEREVRGHDYTRKGPDAGFLLALRYKPVRRLELPRPPDMRLQQHGWLKVEDPRLLARWGIDASPSP